MLDSGEYTRDDKIIKQLVAKRRVIYNVVDLTSDDDYLKIKLFETSHFEFQEELLEEAESGDYEYEGEYMAFADLEDGRSIKFRGIERTGEFKTGSPKPKGFKFVERDEPYDESILDEVYPLDAILHIPEYDEVKKGFMEMENGEEKEFKLQPSDAYGDHNPTLIQKIPRDKLPKELEKGMMLLITLPNGSQMPVCIEDVTEDSVTIDLNHPLAGKVLNFKIKVVDITS